jgi:U3 small nucleolar RNA-associated protein 3
MAKRRKVSRKSEPTGPREVDSKDARLTVKTYEDVANSEDEHWANQDRIDFDDDDEPRSKRLKRQAKEDDFLEVSDEEVFEEEASESEEEEKEEAASRKKGAKKSAPRAAELSEDEEKGDEEEEGDEGWWGSSRKEYYNADNIETEADALVGCHAHGFSHGSADMNCRKKRQKHDGSRPRSWPRCRRPTLPLTRASG